MIERREFSKPITEQSKVRITFDNLVEKTPLRTFGRQYKNVTKKVRKAKFKITKELVMTVKPEFE